MSLLKARNGLFCFGLEGEEDDGEARQEGREREEGEEVMAEEEKLATLAATAEGVVPIVEPGPEPASASPISQTPAPLTADPAMVAQLEDYKRQLAERDTEIQGYRTESEQMREWRLERELEPRFQATVQGLIDRGWDEDRAREHAAALKNVHVAGLRAQAAEANAKTQYQGQVQEAIALSQKHGVPVGELLSLTPSEMRSRAQTMGRIAGLEKQIADLKKGTVPAQSYEGGQGGGGTSREKRRATLLEKWDLTDAELAELGKL